MGNYGYINAALKGLTQKPLETYSAIQRMKLQSRLEEQEYMKNLQRTKQEMNALNSQPQPDYMEGLNLRGGQIFGQGGEQRGEYLPGSEGYLNTPPIVGPQSLKTAPKPKYKLVPSSIGAKGRLGYGIKEEETKSVKEQLEEDWKSGKTLTDEQKKKIGIYIPPKRTEDDEWGNFSDESGKDQYGFVIGEKYKGYKYIGNNQWQKEY